MADTASGDSPVMPGLDEAGPGLPGLISPGADASRPKNETGGYRVLARKYRPKDFTDLIGQEAMVRTLSNAFATGRIPQAWMLTGVRGVGKTTTARILARGLNWQAADGSGKPTIELATPGVHCQAIIEGRHIDVMEIDAASNNGVDNIRQLNDAVRYAPVSARYKVYIVDEVHMLSTGAFNAFLKTLEEPPPHAKFIFATTEIRKVPVTILSRCQRFDLRRIETGRLMEHLAHICRMEDVRADEAALQALARAAEGSVRDALSLLDQAIAHAAGEVTLETVRDMLGLADRSRIIGLFEAVMAGRLAEALGEFRALYDAGADPAGLVQELAEFTHLVTRLKIIPEAANDAALTQDERVRGAEFAGQLSQRVLARAWQMLLKGGQEVKDAARPVAAAEMLLVRLAHVSELPTPDEVIRQIQRDGGSASPAPAPSAPSGPSGGPARGQGSASAATPRPALSAVATAPRPQAGPAQPAIAAAPRVALASLEDIVALAARRRDIQLQAQLKRDVRLVRIDEGRLEIALTEGGDRAIANRLSARLKEWTGQTWMVAVVNAEGGQTLREREDAARHDRLAAALAHPAVQAALATFPGARVVEVYDRAALERRDGVSDDPRAGDDAGPDDAGQDDAGLAASLEAGEGLADFGEEPYSDIAF
jgi:DNA polymerase-3 subunit gamma/tau